MVQFGYEEYSGKHILKIPDILDYTNYTNININRMKEWVLRGEIIKNKFEYYVVF
jgi:hypothetical protein